MRYQQKFHRLRLQLSLQRKRHHRKIQKLIRQNGKTEEQRKYLKAQYDKISTPYQYEDQLKNLESGAKSLTQQTEKQEKELKSLKQRYVDSVAATGKNSKASKELADQIKKLNSELKENKDKLQKAAEAADELDGSYKNVKKSGGLWHGASWNFVIWGGFHGIALAAQKFMRFCNPAFFNNNTL